MPDLSLSQRKQRIEIDKRQRKKKEPTNPKKDEERRTKEWMQKRAFCRM